MLIKNHVVNQAHCAKPDGYRHQRWLREDSRNPLQILRVNHL